MKSRYRQLGGYALLVLLLDQLTKFWVLTAIPEHKKVTVIPGLLDLINIRNRGAAFGFLNRSDIEWQFWLFLLATLAAVTAIILLVRTSHEQPWLFRALGLVMGGALGNLVDRLRFRAVVDFLDIYVGDWHWPAFNVADMAICAGAALACFLLWKQPHPQRGADAS